ncbi:MAG: M48 family metallopeptidase [Bacteroidota bacterium]
MTSSIFILIISILILSYIFDSWLDYLNHEHYKMPLPSIVDGLYTTEKLTQQQSYHNINYKVDEISSFISFVLTLAILLMGVLPWFDVVIRSYTNSAYWQALFFFIGIGLVFQLISLPFSIYSTFVIEQKFGFNKITPKLYILDMIKSIVLSLVIGGGLMFLIIWFWQITQDLFWLYAWGTFTVFSLFMMLFYSNIIVPLFNKQTPLPQGELRTAIELFANKVNFELNNIYIIDASKRSTKSNAYFTGLGKKKRIVLYDTLLDHNTTAEIVAILAHEIGHYKHKHTLWGSLISIVQTGVFLYIFGIFINIPFFALSLGGEIVSFHMSIISFGLLLEPISLILGILSSKLSRHFEYQADDFVVNQGLAGDLIDALKKLSVDNLSNINPHPFYVFVHYSHPPLHLRLENLMKQK